MLNLDKEIYSIEEWDTIENYKDECDIVFELSIPDEKDYKHNKSWLIIGKENEKIQAFKVVEEYFIDDNKPLAMPEIKQIEIKLHEENENYFDLINILAAKNKDFTSTIKQEAERKFRFQQGFYSGYSR